MGLWFPFISSLILTALIVCNQTIFFKEWIAAVDQLNTFTPSEYMFFSLELKWKINRGKMPSLSHLYMHTCFDIGQHSWWQLQNILIVFHARNKHALYQKMYFIQISRRMQFKLILINKGMSSDGLCSPLLHSNHLRCEPPCYFRENRRKIKIDIWSVQDVLKWLREKVINPNLADMN